MENATKALLIAGGILIGLMIITLFVFMLRNVATIKNQERQKEEKERLFAWNAEWEAYNKKVLYGVDIISVINKAQQNNSDYSGNPNYQVTVKVYKSATSTEEYTEEELMDLKMNVFKCRNIGYSENIGRVNYVEFYFIK